MNYTNNSSRLQLRSGQERTPLSNPETILSLEVGKHGLCLRVRKASTAARRKLGPFKLAALTVLALAAGTGLASAQLGYDPFAGNASHTEETWAPYTDASTGGTNRPVSTTINGVSTPGSAGMFSFAVTAASAEPAFLTSGGNIYSPTSTLTLTLTSTYVPASGTFDTVIFSIKTLGNPLNAGSVLLTPNGGQAIAPRFTSVAMTGSGMGASAQYAFQYDLSGIGGSNNFTIAVPGSAASVSFSSAQLDTTTSIFGGQNAVPEPSAVGAVVAGSLGVVGMLRRQHKHSMI